MRVGLITDTHIPDIEEELPHRVAEIFAGVDLILHAGDIYQAFVIDELERIAPVLVALGDDDSISLLKDDRVETRHELELEGHRIWLVHDLPWMYRIPGQMKDGAPDVIVHGHSHAARVFDNDGVLIVGTGSPTFLYYKRGPGTVGLLDITTKGVETTIVRL
jgi:putative phosphoesterase